MFEKLYNEWLNEAGVENRKIALVTYIPNNLCHTSYEGWKTSCRDDYYNEKTIERKIDLDYLHDEMEEAYAESFSENDLPSQREANIYFEAQYEKIMSRWAYKQEEKYEYEYE